MNNLFEILDTYIRRHQSRGKAANLIVKNKELFCNWYSDDDSLSKCWSVRETEIRRVASDLGLNFENTLKLYHREIHGYWPDETTNNIIQLLNKDN